jgi:hypothetical protein
MGILPVDDVKHRQFFEKTEQGQQPNEQGAQSAVTRASHPCHAPLVVSCPRDLPPLFLPNSTGWKPMPLSIADTSSSFVTAFLKMHTDLIWILLLRNWRNYPWKPLKCAQSISWLVFSSSNPRYAQRNAIKNQLVINLC